MAQSKSRESVASDGEVTEVVHRHIKPGCEAQYEKWFSRLMETMKRFPGYRGGSVIIPDHSNLDERIIIYRFADEESMNKWRNSSERQKLLWEVDKYATQTYTRAKGMDTWFQLKKMQYETHTISPPKWKMASVLFVSATFIGIISRLILTPYVGGYSLYVTAPIYALILVLSLTYVVMPFLTERLKKWLYPNVE